jgi:hypothetical protein
LERKPERQISLRRHNVTSTNITYLIEIGAFQQAYEQLVDELIGMPDSKELMGLSRVLSERVRSKCIDLACNKATDGSAAALQLEALLKKIIEVNGEHDRIT